MNKPNKIKFVLLLAMLLAAGAPALAKNGVDDPPGHTGGGNGMDDPTGNTGGGNGMDDPTGNTGGGNGMDDPAGHTDGGNGMDDPTGNTGGGNGTNNPSEDDQIGGQPLEPGDDRGHGIGLERGDDHGVHEIQIAVENTVTGVQNRKIDDNPAEPSKVTGNLKHVVRKNGQIESFDLHLKVRFRSSDSTLGMNTITGAQNAAVLLIFRDDTGLANSECRFEFDERDGNNLEYRIKQIRNGQELREKEGACDTDLSNDVADPGIPIPTGGRAEIYVNTVNGNQTIGEIQY